MVDPRRAGHMEFPIQHRAKLHATNPLERLNGGIELRSDGRDLPEGLGYETKKEVGHLIGAGGTNEI